MELGVMLSFPLAVILNKVERQRNAVEEFPSAKA